LIYTCSGAADVGAIADRTARRLDEEGVGNMSCLAGIGGRVPVLMKKAQHAPLIFAIDGCPHACAKHCLEHAGFTGFAHFTVTDFDMPKGESPPTRERIEKVAHAIRQAIC
jgi:uncharacterized metal-binding protein